MKEYTIDDWKSCFPFDEPRDEQVQAINFILNSFLNDEKRVCIADLGTGIGKSAIAVCVAKYLNQHGGKIMDDEGMPLSGAYFLTTQKILQQQYINDFYSKGMLTIKSASNYKCKFYTDQSCAESRRILSSLAKQLNGSEFQKCCRGSCQYSEDKQAFLESPLSVTNFSYFLAETMYAKKLTPRELLVIDEAHNTEAALGSFIEITFSERFARDILKCKVPALNSQEAVVEWIKKTYKPKLSKYLVGLEKALHSKFKDTIEGFGEYSKQYEMADKHICKVNRFLTAYTPDNWIMNINRPVDSKRGSRKFEFKSIDVSSFSHDMLFRFGGRVLLMSATIIDKDVFCKSIGLEPADASYLRIASPFKVENRPIHYLPAGSMSIKNIEKTLPIMAETVSLLLDQHPNEKGIIHCVNFKVVQYLLEHVKTDRLITHNSDNREEIIKFHKNDPRPTVLLSPSMMEGVDLSDEASRFQILCKVPFPYLGDDVVKKRMLRTPSWYPFQTAKSVIQAFGRSIRNESDHAVSYILDADWEAFYRRNRSMFPVEFSSSLT